MPSKLPHPVRWNVVLGAVGAAEVVRTLPGLDFIAAAATFDVVAGLAGFTAADADRTDQTVHRLRSEDMNQA